MGLYHIMGRGSVMFLFQFVYLSLRYAPGRFVFEFTENQMGDDIIVTLSKSSQNNCPYSNSIKPTNFILDTSIQHLMI